MRSKPITTMNIEPAALWHLKHCYNPAQLTDEVAADSLYRACGVAVPFTQGVSPMPGTDTLPLYRASVHVPGNLLNLYMERHFPEEVDAMLNRLAADLAVDAWLGALDVIGTEGQNIIVDRSGRPWRVDNGHALRWRGKTGRKSAAEWTPDAREDLAKLRRLYAFAFSERRAPAAAVAARAAAIPPEIARYAPLECRELLLARRLSLMEG